MTAINVDRMFRPCQSRDTQEPESVLSGSQAGSPQSSVYATLLPRCSQPAGTKQSLINSQTKWPEVELLAAFLGKTPRVTMFCK